jgi:NAD(P)-dependent dehydrogenase (short-subunit alcohol dehydrogenase family)
MNNTTFDFTGKVAFITGAATGIGRATALAFAKNKAKVALADVNTDEGLKTLHLVRDAGGEGQFFKCDVSSAAQVESAVNETVKLFGGIDFAFNNAGIEGEQGGTKDCSIENWDRVININLKGVWLCMKYQVPVMLKQKRGSIINCSSIAGLVGFAGIPAYAASKHGVVGLTKSAALEFAKLNIRVNAICPGVIQTPMIDRFTHGEAQAQQMLVAGEPVGRVGQPEEIADAALWLASDASSFITGHSLAVDGGWVAQ